MMILGIILITIGIISFILGIVLGHTDGSYIFLCFLGALIPIGVGLIVDSKNPKPTKQDVLDGKAIYQETKVITDKDTIKTYDIVWKQKN